MLLEINNVHVHYHKVAALKGIDMSVPEDGIVTIIGANGAGKSTTLRAISGLVPDQQGRDRVRGRAHRQASAGKDRGARHRPRAGRPPHLSQPDGRGEFAHRRLSCARDKAAIEKDLDEVFEHFPRLKERRKQWARSLSGGEQQMLAIGRALMSRPKMLVLDEPSMGLSPVMVQEIARIIREIVGRGVAVVLVEQNAELALRLARFAYVLETGSIALQGPAHELHDNAHVRRAYLGG